jgi:hypothetical protein
MRASESFTLYTHILSKVISFLTFRAGLNFFRLKMRICVDVGMMLLWFLFIPTLFDAFQRHLDLKSSHFMLAPSVVQHHKSQSIQISQNSTTSFTLSSQYERGVMEKGDEKCVSH